MWGRGSEMSDCKPPNLFALLDMLQSAAGDAARSVANQRMDDFPLSSIVVMDPDMAWATPLAQEFRMDVVDLQQKWRPVLLELLVL